jgi:hypothetical protein
MDPTTIGLLISIAPTVLDLLFGRGHGSVIKHEMFPKKMYGYGLEGYGLEGYGLDEYGLGFRYPTVPLVEVEIPRKSKKGTEYKLKKKIPKVDEKWVITYLLNTKNKPPRQPSKWMDFVKQAFNDAKQKYNEYLEKELKKKDRVTYDRLMLNRNKREARKEQLPLAIRYAPGAMEHYVKYKDYPFDKLITEYYSGENVKRIPRKYRPIVLAVREGKEPPKIEEVLTTLSEKKKAKKPIAKK